MIRKNRPIKPIVNRWYVNKTGKLFKVRLLGFSGKKLTSVLLEYFEGNTLLINSYEWKSLDLNLHNWASRRSENILKN